MLPPKRRERPCDDAYFPLGMGGSLNPQIYRAFIIRAERLAFLWRLELSRGQINRNMLFRTPRFMAFGFPSSYSIPAAPPSPDMFSILSRSSASAWATDLTLFAREGLPAGFEQDSVDFGSGLSLGLPRADPVGFSEFAELLRR